MLILVVILLFALLGSKVIISTDCNNSSSLISSGPAKDWDPAVHCYCLLDQVANHHIFYLITLFIYRVVLFFYPFIHAIGQVILIIRRLFNKFVFLTLSSMLQWSRCSGTLYSRWWNSCDGRWRTRWTAPWPKNIGSSFNSIAWMSLFTFKAILSKRPNYIFLMKYLKSCFKWNNKLNYLQILFEHGGLATPCDPATWMLRSRSRRMFELRSDWLCP